jgi:hypothetical protein
MTALDLLQSVQFVTVKGERLAVLGADEWEAMIDWLETLEDTQIAREAFAERPPYDYGDLEALVEQAR